MFGSGTKVNASNIFEDNDTVVFSKINIMSDINFDRPREKKLVVEKIVIFTGICKSGRRNGQKKSSSSEKLVISSGEHHLDRIR